MSKIHFYRMSSWWLRREFLEYPSIRISDDIRRRADALAEAGCDSAIQFGAHFRWDYMPEWDRLHACLREVAETLHGRGIVFFDHFSSTLAARPEHGPNTGASTFPRDHVYLREINHDAERWLFLGKPLNSWRMIDLFTGKPCFNTNYAAEQFCMNNPDFREAYPVYLKKLLSETGIDGLMSDDAIFFSRFSACGCPHCRAKFGRPLPPVTDLDFWGNWRNPDFLDWIDMRYRTVSEFNAVVRSALPKDFPLMNCCSGSICSDSNENGQGAEEFMRAANHLMLEMCGNTPSREGKYTHSLASQLYHLAVAENHRAPCIGLGYAFYPDPAEFIWAFNKFLGSGTWISTLKGRLGLPEEIRRTQIPDEWDIIKRAFRFEKEHPEWFEGERRPENAVYFSRHTRDNYGGNMNDFARDYIEMVASLFEGGVDFDIATAIPHPSSSVKTLYLPSAACLSNTEIRDLEIFLLSGNKVVATGPCGVFDERGRRRASPWIPGIRLPDIVREKAFPENTWIEASPAQCENEPGWTDVRPNLRWHPRRMRDHLPLELPPSGNRDFFRRRFHLADGSVADHFLAAAFDTEVNGKLEGQRFGDKHNNLITKLHPLRPMEKLEIDVGEDVSEVKRILPLQGGEERTLKTVGGKVSFSLPPECFYFLLIH